MMKDKDDVEHWMARAQGTGTLRQPPDNMTLPYLAPIPKAS